MENYKAKCNQCGYTKNIIGNYFEERVCELCGGEMILIEEEKIQNAEDLLDRLITEQIQGEIRENGHTKCWEVIEAINKAETRARYRKYFILAGGIIPEPRPIIFKDTEGKFYFRED